MRKSSQQTVTHLQTAVFHQPAVRHLAWLCLAPQLLDAAPTTFKPAEYLPADVTERLEYWDLHPGSGPSVLTEPPHYRLGLYVESLYECLLRDILGWDILARNLPIRSGGTTLGELDFVVHNPWTGTNEHHEVAIKFYLGYRDTVLPVRWYGPNARDRLDIKTRRMLEQQSQRTRLEPTLATLHGMGIEGPFVRRIFMPGYLFYPHLPSHIEPVPAQLPAPDIASRNHLRGGWMYLDMARQQDLEHTILLRKPHWLGPWTQSEKPEPQAVQHAFEEIERSGTPRLMARLLQDGCSGKWSETERFFVVPASWPGTPPADQDSSITTRSI